MANQTTDHQMELLSGALNAVLRARAAPSIDLPRMESRLMDRAVALGATLDEPDYAEWAACRVAAWLISA